MKLNDSVSVIHPSQRAKLPENPTVNQAINYMKTSMDILDWNMKRARVRRAVGNNNFIKRYLSPIDGKGLCPLTMKKAKSIQKFHTPFVAEKNQKNG